MAKKPFFLLIKEKFQVCIKFPYTWKVNTFNLHILVHLIWQFSPLKKTQTETSKKRQTKQIALEQEFLQLI